MLLDGILLDRILLFDRVDLFDGVVLLDGILLDRILLFDRVDLFDGVVLLDGILLDRILLFDRIDLFDGVVLFNRILRLDGILLDRILMLNRVLRFDRIGTFSGVLLLDWIDLLDRVELLGRRLGSHRADGRSLCRRFADEIRRSKQLLYRRGLRNAETVSFSTAAIFEGDLVGCDICNPYFKCSVGAGHAARDQDDAVICALDFPHTTDDFDERRLCLLRPLVRIGFADKIRERLAA